MACYSVEPRNQIFEKGFRFLSFAKNISKIIDKYISKNLSGKYSQKLPDHAKQSATDVLKTASKEAFQKRAKTTGDLNGNKIVNKTTKNWPQNKSGREAD